MRYADNFIVQTVFLSGAECAQRYDLLSSAVTAHSSLITTGEVQGSAVFSDDGETIIAYGEGPALAFDAKAWKTVSAPRTETEKPQK